MKKKILIVDDNRLLLKFMANILEREGHKVAVAEDGFTALNLLTTFIPDVMFVDIIMPNIDGDKLCKIIRKMQHMDQCYIVIVSAAAAELEFDYAEMGVDACIAKGSFSATAKHVLAVLKEFDITRKTAEERSIIGLDSIYPRQMTKELLSRNRHLETILESMSQGILEVLSNRVVYANSAAVAFLGAPLEEILSSYPQDLFSEAEREKVMAILQSENSFISDDNTLLELKGRLVTIKNIPVKKKSTSIIIITDVTKQKRLENQLHQARKMEAIGTLAGGVAHDFNNLLMGIQGNASIILLDMDTANIHYGNIKSIKRCVEKGADLTRQLLGFARGGKYNMKPACLNKIADETSNILEQLGKPVRVYKDYQKNIWTINVDRKQLEQVLITLYINACQALAESGDVYIKTENIILNQDFAEQFEVKPGRYVKLSVTDTGAGISEENSRHIFEPFFTTKKIGNGAGLGLAAAFGIIKNHDGIIDFSSEKDKGTTFNVYLPAITT